MLKILKVTCRSCRRNIEIEGEDIPSFIDCPSCKEHIDLPNYILGAGEEIEGYRIKKHIGHGANACVYLVEHLESGSELALKIIEWDEAGADDSIARFNNEIRILAYFDHPNFVSIFESGEYTNHSFVAMRYINGQTLQDHIGYFGPIQEIIALRIMSSIASAMDYGWKQGELIHRDIKPDNVMIDTEFEPFLLDFGISKLADDPEDMLYKGKIVGTPFHMSPEQANDASKVDFNTDIYSLACTMFFSVTGERPYDGDHFLQVVIAHQRREIPDVRDLNPDLSPAFSELLKKAMAKKPEERFESWEDFQNGVKAVQKSNKRRRYTQIDLVTKTKGRLQQVFLDYPQQSKQVILCLIGISALILIFLTARVFIKFAQDDKVEETVLFDDQDRPSVDSVVDESIKQVTDINDKPVNPQLDKIIVEQEGLKTYLQFDQLDQNPYQPRIIGNGGQRQINGPIFKVPAVDGSDALELTGYTTVEINKFGTITNSRSFTVCFWFKTNTLLGKESYILSRLENSSTSKGWVISIEKAKLTFQMIQDLSTQKQFSMSANLIASNDWFHIAITNDVGDDQPQILMNGKLQPSTINVNNLDGSSGYFSDCLIGNPKGKGIQNFSIDNIRFYQQHLSRLQIQRIYESEK